MAYKHLFFDLDHTLWDFETNAKETFRELHSLYALHEKGIEDFDAFFSRYSFHNERLWERYTKGYVKQEELRWKRVWLALLDFKIADEPLARKMSEQFLEDLPSRRSLFPYTTEILDYLRQKNYVLHLITNGFDNIQHSKLKHSNLTAYFKEVITSEKCGSLKPHKEIFDFALRITNAKAEESIMIGDNIEADIKGAMAAGIDTIFVNHIKAETDVQPTYTIYHLKELEDIF
ncbi:YjjG family noncanonical pyrimidine nucleotidase [Parafilimonas sp.]|uniref:YjjG family noncanonical pyrimidine nucleotidase n=1 Tax=Parafilimonas sp. TaxID=1969739 RepID=UPI0039E5D080